MGVWVCGVGLWSGCVECRCVMLVGVWCVVCGVRRCVVCGVGVWCVVCNVSGCVVCGV